MYSCFNVFVFFKNKKKGLILMSFLGLKLIIFILVNLVNCQPSVCTKGMYNGNGYIVCGSRISGGYQELWIHHTNPYGTYDMLSICQSFGYTSVYQSKGTYNSICGYGKNSSYSGNNVQSWSSMWPENENLWTKKTYTDCCQIAWVCRRLLPPTLSPSKKICLGPSLKCNQVITKISWGIHVNGIVNGIDFTATGYGTKLGEFTLVALTALDSIGITCNDINDGITFTSSHTMRALMGNYTSNKQFPTSYGGCASKSDIYGIYNSPFDPISAKQICRQLGYINGSVIIGWENMCPEAYYDINTDTWSSDFIRSPEWGKSFTCFNSCPPRWV